MDRKEFEAMYREQAPWDISRPQYAIVELAEAGEIRGEVLDAGCGSGENAIYIAAQGHDTWGIDFAPTAIERAKAKARQQGVNVEFQVFDALELDKLRGPKFGTVIDCGLFHTFDDFERRRYLLGLGSVCRVGGVLHLMCFSDQEPPGVGPRRISKDEIHEAFRAGWRVERIAETHFEVIDEAAPAFTPGGPKAWLATIQRL